MKKTAKKSGNSDTSFVIGDVAKTDTVTFVNRRKKGSKYDAILEAVNKLKLGQTLPVTNKLGNMKTFGNRLNGVINAATVTPPDGCAIVKNAIEGGYAYSCVDAKDAPKGAFKGPKAK